jgi:hypothetical protein
MVMNYFKEKINLTSGMSPGNEKNYRAEWLER